MTATPTRHRGACPDALAEEVHRRTLAGMMTRFAAGRHRQTIDDAVTEAFVRWYGNATDKTTHPGGHHAHWLIRTATAYILNTSRHVGGRHVRPCASWAAVESESQDSAHREEVYHERIIMAFYNVAGAMDHEDNLISAMDDMRAFLLESPVDEAERPPIETWTDAMAALRGNGWSCASVARTLGVSGSAARAWHAGTLTPSKANRAALLQLALARTPPPAERTKTQAQRDFHNRDATLGGWRRALHDLLEVGPTRAAVARRIGVDKESVYDWTSGRCGPTAKNRAAILACAAQNAAPAPPSETSQESARPA